VTWRLGRVADVDTGTLRGDLVELATQVLDIYAGDTGRAAMRLTLEAASIPGMAEHGAAMRQAQARAAKAIVRRGIRRGEAAPGTSAALLLNTLTGGAMMLALSTPEERRADLARNTGARARRLVDFLLRAVRAPEEEPEEDMP
jgi:Tetracyclin repressor-like, C-terminal domain